MDVAPILADAFKPVDPLGEALHALRMSGTFYCRSELTAPWGMDLPAMPNCLLFHAVTEGSCWVELPGGEPHLLRAGDFSLLPHGQGHLLRDDLGSEVTPLFDLPVERISDRYEILRSGGGGARTTLICGAVSFENPAAQRVVRMLPRMITIEAHAPGNEWILNTVRFMTREAQELRPGGDTIITRVSDILVIQAIRSWLEDETQVKTGWLAALKDAQIGRAIALVHRHPMRPWSVASLAETVGMSRSAFAARFQSLAEETPMSYVRRWRMHVAAGWLQEGDEPINEMAERLGYQSEAAFNRAFKKVVGKTPGAVRRESRKQTRESAAA